MFILFCDARKSRLPARERTRRWCQARSSLAQLGRPSTIGSVGGVKFGGVIEAVVLWHRWLCAGGEVGFGGGVCGLGGKELVDGAGDELAEVEVVEAGVIEELLEFIEGEFDAGSG